MLCPLSLALTYENPALLARYQRDYPQHTLPADIALQEIIKYLWMTEKQRQDRLAFPENPALNFSARMYPEMAEIDNMWHTFLLFTRDYADFCERYLGRFIHHVPNTNADDALSPEAFELDFTRYLSYVFDELGAETVKRWFAEYV